jgi:putative component of membrane protein insertase Oxa1/YidC/SpoIIIJ protein YidD
MKAAIFLQQITTQMKTSSQCLEKTQINYRLQALQDNTSSADDSCVRTRNGMNSIIDRTAVHCILWYKNSISPRKGYRCAHNALYKSGSCSSWALNIVRTEGTLIMLSKIGSRFNECNDASKEITSEKKKKNGNTGETCYNSGEAACCCLSLFPWSLP